jgi:hypothetical protein
MRLRSPWCGGRCNTRGRVADRRGCAAHVRKRTDRDKSEVQTACTMKQRPSESRGPSDGAAHFAEQAAVPAEVFYVVLSKGTLGERDHCLRSALYETRPQADLELARMRAADSGGSYDVWKSATYIEPAEWLHRVVRADGTLILPRLRGVEKCGDTPPNRAAGPS